MHPHTTRASAARSSPPLASPVTLKSSSKVANRLAEGQETKVFQRNGRVDLKNRSLSIIHSNGKKTLDLVCKDDREYRVCVIALRYLIAYGPPADHHKMTRSKSIRPTMSSVQEVKSGDDKKYTTRKDLQSSMKIANDVYVFGCGGWGQLGLGLERCVVDFGTVH
jgi:hypothetical protein